MAHDPSHRTSISSESGGTGRAIRDLAHKLLNKHECDILKAALKHFRATKSVPYLCTSLSQVVNTKQKTLLLTEIRHMLPDDLRPEFERFCSELLAKYKNEEKHFVFPDSGEKPRGDSDYSLETKVTDNKSDSEPRLTRSVTPLSALTCRTEELQDYTEKRQDMEYGQEFDTHQQVDRDSSSTDLGEVYGKNPNAAAKRTKNPGKKTREKADRSKERVEDKVEMENHRNNNHVQNDLGGVNNNYTDNRNVDEVVKPKVSSRPSSRNERPSSRTEKPASRPSSRTDHSSSRSERPERPSSRSERSSSRPPSRNERAPSRNSPHQNGAIVTADVETIHVDNEQPTRDLDKEEKKKRNKARKAKPGRSAMGCSTPTSSQQHLEVIAPLASVSCDSITEQIILANKISAQQAITTPMTNGTNTGHYGSQASLPKAAPPMPRSQSTHGQWSADPGRNQWTGDTYHSLPRSHNSQNAHVMPRSATQEVLNDQSTQTKFLRGASLPPNLQLPNDLKKKRTTPSRSSSSVTINTQGRLVEIRKVKLSRSSGQSLGFSIRGGKDVNSGVYVSDVSKGGQAQSQGLLVGDRILKVNDVSFRSVTHDEAVQVVKRYMRLVLYVTSSYQEAAREGERSAQIMGPNGRLVTVQADTDGWLGCSIKGGTDYSMQPMISNVDPGSPAALAGLKTGDVITRMNGVDITSLTHAQIVALATSSRVLRLHIKPFELPERQDEARDSVYASGRSSHETTPTPTNHFNDCTSPGAVMVTPNVEHRSIVQKQQISPDSRPGTPGKRRSPEDKKPAPVPSPVTPASPQPVRLQDPKKPEDRKDRRQRKKKSDKSEKSEKSDSDAVKKKSKKGEKSESSRTSSVERKGKKNKSDSMKEEVYPESVELENEERVEIRKPGKEKRVVEQPERDVDLKYDAQRRRSHIADPKFNKEVSGDSAVLDELNRRNDDTDVSEAEMPNMELAVASLIDPPEPKFANFIPGTNSASPMAEEPTREWVDERRNSQIRISPVIQKSPVQSPVQSTKNSPKEISPTKSSPKQVTPVEERPNFVESPNLRIPTSLPIPSPEESRIPEPNQGISPERVGNTRLSPEKPVPDVRRSSMASVHSTRERTPEKPPSEIRSPESEFSQHLTHQTHQQPSPQSRSVYNDPVSTPEQRTQNSRSDPDVISPEIERFPSEVEEWDRPVESPPKGGFKPIVSQDTEPVRPVVPERRETTRTVIKPVRQVSDTTTVTTTTTRSGGYDSTRSEFDSHDQYSAADFEPAPRKRLGSVSSQTTMSTTASTQTDDLLPSYAASEPVVLRERPVRSMYPGPIDVYEVVRVGDDERRIMLQEARPYLTRAESDMLLSRRLPAPADSRTRAQSSVNLQDPRFDHRVDSYYNRPPVYLIRERAPPTRPDYYPYLYPPEAEWSRSIQDLYDDYWPEERFVPPDMDEARFQHPSPRRYPRYPHYPEYPRSFPRYPRYPDFMDEDPPRPGTADFSPVRKPKDAGAERLRFMSKSADQGLNQPAFYKSRPRTTPQLNKMNSLEDTDPCYSTQSDRPSTSVPETTSRYGSDSRHSDLDHYPDRHPHPERPASQQEAYPDRPAPHPDLDRVRGISNARQSPSIPDSDTNSSREQIPGFREQFPGLREPVPAGFKDQYRDKDPYREKDAYREPGFRDPYRYSGYPHSHRQSDPFLREDRLAPPRDPDYPVRDSRDYMPSPRPPYSREDLRDGIDERLGERPDYRHHEPLYRQASEPSYSTPRRRTPHHHHHHHPDAMHQSIPSRVPLYDYDRYHTASDRDLRDLDPYACLAEHSETYLTASLRGSRVDLSTSSLRGSKVDLSQTESKPANTDLTEDSEAAKTPIIENQAFPFEQSAKERDESYTESTPVGRQYQEPRSSPRNSAAFREPRFAPHGERSPEGRPYTEALVVTRPYPERTEEPSPRGTRVDGPSPSVMLEEEEEDDLGDEPEDAEDTGYSVQLNNSGEQGSDEEWDVEANC